MTVNEATWDRAIRVVAGTLGTVFKFLGFVPLLTGIIGYCPAYPLLGFRTKKA